jgi:hypothetical protein
LSNADSIAQNTPHQAIFDKKFGNGKMKIDKFSVNTYIFSPKSINNINDITLSMIKEKYYTTSLPEILNIPEYIVSEYGCPRGASDRAQNTFLGPFFVLDSNASTKGFRDLILNKNWKIESMMYYKWSSKQDAVNENESMRSINYYGNIAIQSGTVSGSNGSATLTFSSAVPSTWRPGGKITQIGTVTNFPNQGVYIKSISSNTVTLWTTLSANISFTLTSSNYLQCLSYRPRKAAKTFQNGTDSYNGSLILEDRVA